MPMQKYVKYPIYPQTRLFDKIALKIGAIPAIFCPVCGNVAAVTAIKDNLRESCLCTRCKSINRQRQLAYVLCKALSSIRQKRIHCLRNFVSDSDIDLAIYNTECTRAIHNNLSGMKNYICSEYYGPQYKSGEMVNGVLHEDLINLSFVDETIDIVLSSDVLEHVPRPYDAHREIWRVLKPKGRHIFTVPFYQTEFLDETRAMHDENGELRLMKEPQYHGDPLRPEGALVYTIFSLQMLVEMRKIGFRTNLYHLYKPWYGILGSNAIVFEAIKV
jgi:SAM-dependent methyltransferase